MEMHYFDCQCNDFGHVVRIALDENDGELWLEVRLSHFEPWYKRALKALKYLFKVEQSYGHYDITMLKEEDYDRIRDLFNKSQLAKAAAHSRFLEQKNRG